MFCPKCKAEYQAGVLVCDDCQVDLVEEFPEGLLPQDKDNPEFECIAELFNLDLGAIPLIKSVLDEEHVVYFIQGENALYAQPAIAARLMVIKSQAERAREILKDLI
jgi:hypothetical protein